MKLSLPQLTYPIVQEYTWPLFTPLMMLASLLALGILVPLNVALTGYQTILTPSRNFQEVPVHWYNRFSPLPEPGSLCTPLNLSAGSSFATTSGIFQWTIVLPNNTDGSAQVIPYRGANFDTCDVWDLRIEADLMRASVGLSAAVLCNSTDFPIYMTTSWKPWGGTVDLPVYDYPTNYAALATTTGPVSDILFFASFDLFSAMLASYNANHSSVHAFTVDFMGDLCPKTPQGAWDCTTINIYGKDEFSLEESTNEFVLTQAADGSLKYQDGVSDFGKLNDDAIGNVVQALNAAVRLDLGYILPNNFLTNNSVVNATIVDIPVYGNGNDGYSLYTILQNPQDSYVTYPVPSMDETTINVSFQCRFKHPKSLAEILVSVFVATVTMFNGGWAAVMFITSYLATKAPEANACITHAAEAPYRWSRIGSKSSAEEVELAGLGTEAGTITSTTRTA